MQNSQLKENLIGPVTGLENAGKGLLFSVIEVSNENIKEDFQGAQEECQNDIQQGVPENVSINANQRSFNTESFDKKGAGKAIPAFAIRYDNEIYAFKNRCGHIAVTLDFQPGSFFSEEGDTLICATHGASYAPTTGKCLGGPCFGIGLEAIDVCVIEGELFLNDASLTLVNNENS